MTVPELRRAIIAQIPASRTANGKPVYTLPNGNIVSKAKKGELEAYLADLNLAQDAIDHFASVTAEQRHKELERLIKRHDRIARKYGKRRPRPNNIKLALMHQAKRDDYVREAQENMASAA